MNYQIWDENSGSISRSGKKVRIRISKTAWGRARGAVGGGQVGNSEPPQAFLLSSASTSLYLPLLTSTIFFQFSLFYFPIFIFSR
jgi:hypothetical protein